MKKWTFFGSIAIALLSSFSIAVAEEKPRVVLIPLFDERTGNAVEEDVLSGVTFSNADAIGLTGTMPDNGAVNVTPGTTAQSIPEGYHDGAGTVAGDADLTAGNIKGGVEIFGTTGTAIEASGNAAASQVLSGQTFSNSSAAGLTGTMPDNGAVNVTPGTTAQSIPEGYHDGAGTVAGDADLTAGNIKGGVEIFGTTGTAIEASGNAAASQVLSGQTFSNSSAAGLTGTMPDNGAVNVTPGTTAQSIPEGYHDGAGTVAGDADLTAGNIKGGVEIFGTTGTAIEASGNAAASQVLSGQTFSNSSAAGLTGTMPDNGAVNVTPGTTAQSIPEGYHDGAGTVAGDADLTAGNIKGGVEIFGTTGTAIEASGNAAASQVLSGQTFSNSSAAGLTGTMPDNGAVNVTPGTTAQSIPEGYHDGAGTVAGDADLTAGNIKGGVEIFGTTGTAIEASGNAAASQVLSGQTFSNSSAAGLTGTMPDNEGDNASVTQALEVGVVELTAPTGFYDGDDTVTATEAQIVALEPNLLSENIKEGTTIFGVSGNLSYFSSPSPRFTVNGDGTVLDHLTNLVWMKRTGCVGGGSQYAMENLYDGGQYGDICGLSDGSVSGDWRWPSIKELISLADYSQHPTKLPSGHPFESLCETYISTDTRTDSPSDTSFLRLNINWGTIDYFGGSTLCAWPVKNEYP